jgi:protein-serine/threonine kinase
LTTQKSSSSLPRDGQSGHPATRDQQGREQGRASPRVDTSRADAARHQDQNRQPGTPRMQQPNGQQQQMRTQQNNQVPKPLNVQKPNAPPKENGISKMDAVKAAEAALTAKPPPQTQKQKDQRMSTMSESEVMAKLKEVVSKDDPSMSYAKQKKIGQGASGSVYVAKVKENAISPIAREVLREQGSRAQVAIKQMDLAHQPRKELIVNEIMVMKDSKHRNIVNFLDAFLKNNFTELWVVMEYMEGGALTDVIDNNQRITESQIATICLEVGHPSVF